jgi:hypothetical protein
MSPTTVLATTICAAWSRSARHSASHSASDTGDPDLVVPARESREPNARFDSVKFAVDVDVLELVDQNYRWIAQKRDIADSELDLKPFVRCP